MTITNGYCTLVQLKGRLGIEAGDTSDDAELEKVVEGVCRFIDRDRRRVFYATTATRYWTPRHSDRVWVDDLITITSVSVATTTALSYAAWAVTDYLTEPYNGEGPIQKIVVHPAAGKYFVPGLLKSVQVAGSYGYAAAVPDEIEQAAILLAQYMWLRKDAPFGTAGFAMLGEIAANPELMPADIRGLINSVPRRIAR